MNPRRATWIVVGGICGLTWAAAFRGWMAQLAKGQSHSTVTWLTLVLVLLPGAAIGSLLGWSAYLRSASMRAPTWLVFCPVLFASALLDPKIFRGLVTNGTGGGALIVIATALSIGFVLSRCRWSIRRAACAVVGTLGLLMIWGIGGMAAPTSTPLGMWVSLYGFALVLLFGLAAVLPYAPVRGPTPAQGWVGLGALVGLAWACSLRSFMAEVAADESSVDWVLTFGFILLPGAVIGASLGWAEVRRRRGRLPQWRLVLAPFLFAAVLFSDPLHLGELFQKGIGGGTVGVPAIAILGGFAVSGRGRKWARVVAGAAFLAGFTTWILVATDVGGPSLSLTTAHGIWVSTLYESLLVVFALATSASHRASVETTTVALPAGLHSARVPRTPHLAPHIQAPSAESG